MPAGTIIGRISVKVLPDTDDFRRDAQKKLDLIEKGLQVEARIELKDTGLAQQAKAARAKAQAQMKDLTLNVNLDNQKSLMRSIGQIQAELDKLDDTTLKVSLNRDDLNAAADLLKERLDEVATLDLRIDKKSQAGLESAISKIDQQLTEMEKIDFSVKLDRPSLIKARDEIQAELESKIQLQVEVDRQAANAVRERIVAQLRDIPISTKLDEAKIKTVMRQIEGYLDQLEDLKAVITPEMDERAKAKVNRDIDDIKDKIDKLKAEIKPDVSMPFWANAWKTLATLTRDRFVHIYPKVNKAALAASMAAINRLSGARVVTTYVRELGEALGDLDKSAPKIGLISTAIVTLGGAATNALGSVFSLAGSLISMAPAVLALPGLFSGMALGAVAAGIAFQDFNKHVPELKARWDELRTTISDNFWDKAAKPMRDMVATLFPQFAAGMSLIGTKAGEFFGKFSDSLSKALDGRLEGMFANLGKSIDIAGNSTGSLANIIAILGDLGSQYLPLLAQWFVDITQKFSDFLTRASASGELKTWVDNGIAAFLQLADVLKSLGSIFLSLSEAATLGGGGTLGGMAVTLAAIAKAADSPAFKGGLAEFFRSIRESMDLIGQQAGPALERMFSSLLTTFSNVLPTAAMAVGTAMDAIATALADPAFSAGISSMFEGLKVGIAALAPVVSTVGPVLGMLAQVVGTLLAALGPLIAAVLSALLPALSSLLPVLMPIIEILGGALTQIVTALAPVLAAIATLFAQLLAAVIPLLAPLIQLVMAILTPLLAVITQVITAAMPPLVDAFLRLSAALAPVIEILTAVVSVLMTALAPAIEFVAGQAINILVAAIESIAQVFEGVVKIVMGIWNAWSAAFRGDWSAVWESVKQVWSGVWDVISGLFSLALVGILNALKVAGTAISSVWSSIWNGIKSFFSSIWDSITSFLSGAMSAIVDLISVGLRNMKGNFTESLNLIKSTVTTAFNAVKTTVSDKIGDVVSTLKDLPGKAKAALGNMSSLLIDAGKQLIQGFIDGIKGMFGNVQGALGSLTSSLPDWKGPESLDRVLLVDAGRLVIGGFIRGMESQYDAVRRSLSGLTADISGMAITGPSVSGAASRSLAAKLSAAMGDISTDGPVIKQFIYNAAPNQSLDAEEDLFDAVGRARWGW
ncbi:hypothetical protein AB0I95_14920 [Micromonospora sp. NPDC049751]|uniref:hypothetical protein n=1 Tax=Micromonospora sp. NPDC049751 TaxID=3154837 RepID=UPI00340B2A3C